MSSHLMGEVQDTADHLVVVGRGRAIADAGVADLIAAASRGRVAVWTSAGTHAMRVLAHAGAADLHSLPLRPWAGLGVTAGWAAAALVAGGLLIRKRDA